MEKKDWQESVRQEKASSVAAGGESKTRIGSGDSSYPSRWSRPGDDGMSADDANASGYAPKIDETKCLLWAHGGQSHPAIMIVGARQAFLALIHRWVLFRECRSGKVRSALPVNRLGLIVHCL